MEEITFTFGGFNSARDLNLIVNEVERGILGDITEVIQEIPAMVGNSFLGMNYGAKKIEIECTMKTDTEEDRAELIHELGNLFNLEGNDEYDLILSDEPRYIYEAHVSSISVPERISQTNSWSKFTITFSCSTPYAFSEQVDVPILEETQNIVFEGSAPTFPVITIVPKTDLKEIAITNSAGEYVYIGEGENTESNASEVNKEPRIVRDECNTLATWTKITEDNLKFNMENVHLASDTDLKAGANSLRIAEKSGKPYFGAATKGKWHGAGRFLTLPESCSDWRVRVRIYNNQNSYRAKNKIEVYLLDELGNRIGKLMLKDNDNSRRVGIGADVGKSTDSRKIIYGSIGSEKDVPKKANTTTRKVTVKVGTKTVTQTKKDSKTGKTTKTKKTVADTKTVNLTYEFKYSTYTDFYGWLQLQKIGNAITFTLQQLTSKGAASGKQVVKKYTDTGNHTMNKKLASIACVISKYDNTEDFIDGSNSTEDAKIAYVANDMALCDVMVWNILDGGNAANTERPVVAYEGEQIVIDSQDNRVYKNGVPFMEELNLGSTFFQETGRNESAYSFYPSPDEATITLGYTPSKY